MATFPWGALIGAGASVFGSALGSSGARSADRANIRAQQRINRQNRRLQMKTNKNQIQWLVDDAHKAGINPLAALGSSAAGNIAAPVMGDLPSRTGSSVGDGIAKGGALLGSGIDNMLAIEHAARQNEKLMLENAMSRTMIAGAAGAAQRAPIRTFGVDLQPTGKFSKSQDAEDEIGELADWVVGAPNFIDMVNEKFKGNKWVNAPATSFSELVLQQLMRIGSKPLGAAGRGVPATKR